MTFPQYPAEALERLRHSTNLGWVESADGHEGTTVRVADLAALLSYVEGVKWQPIESAPDNEDVLLVVPRYGSSKFPIYEMAVGRMGRDGGWYSDSDETDEYRLHEPKYWRPLPPAPDREG